MIVLLVIWGITFVFQLANYRSPTFLGNYLSYRTVNLAIAPEQTYQAPTKRTTNYVILKEYTFFWVTHEEGICMKPAFEKNPNSVSIVFVFG